MELDNTQMNPVYVSGANGGEFHLPMFDPLVAAHFKSESSMAGTLLDEINTKKIYAPLFDGKRDLTFLDIGANIGLVSLYAYEACQRIVAVEPAPATFAVLKSITFPLTKIERVQAALAPQDGPCEFFTNDQNTTASSTINTFGAKSEVPGLTLSSILSIHQLEHVDVCKVDAEGSEELSLNGHELQSALPFIDSYWIETHSTPTSIWGETLGRIANTLHYLGYKKQSIVGMRLMASKR